MRETVIRNDFKSLEKCIKFGLGLNKVNTYPAWKIASKENKIKAIILLFKINNFKELPINALKILITAIETGATLDAKELIIRGAPLNTQRTCGHTALITAVISGNRSLKCLNYRHSNRRHRNG